MTTNPSRGGLLGIAGGIYSRIWRLTATGLLIWVPLIITLWVSWIVLDKLVFGIERLIRTAILAVNALALEYPALGFLVPIRYRFGFGVLAVILLFMATGYLTRYIIGQRLIAFGERLVRFIPFINRVYQAVVQIRDVFVSREGAVFQKVCLVQYPRQGMLAVAFVTASEQGLIQEVAGRELVAVFVPTTPNPTSGYLVYLPSHEIQLLDITVEEAMKLIVSGGAYFPAGRGPAAVAPPETAAEPDRASSPRA